VVLGQCRRINTRKNDIFFIEVIAVVDDSNGYLMHMVYEDRTKPLNYVNTLIRIRQKNSLNDGKLTKESCETEKVPEWY